MDFLCVKFIETLHLYYKLDKSIDFCSKKGKIKEKCISKFEEKFD